jgi:hypothetical protein
MPTLLPNAKQTFTGPNGVPLSGGSVYFYIPNTSTPKATYQDPAQTILNTNPVILDANGQAVIWGSGTYRQVVYDANNNLVWDQITEDTSGGLLGNMTDNVFVAGTDFTPGVTTQLTLTAGPGSITNTWIYFDAAYQDDSQASVSGTTLIFTSPIPVGVGKVTVKIGSTVAIGTPGNGTVTDSSAASGTRLYNRIFDLVDVRDPPFNAVGNGVTNDTAAIDAASASINGPVIIPPNHTWLYGGSIAFDQGLTLRDKGSSGAPVHNTMTISRDVSSTGTTAQQVGALLSYNTVESSVTHNELGILSVMNDYAASTALQNVSVYGQANSMGTAGSPLWAAVFEVKNTTPTGGGSTVDHVLQGIEVDVANGLPYSATQKKSGVEVIAFGGFECNDGYSIHAANDTYANGTYNTGAWRTGINVYPNSINPTLGIAMNIQSSHGTGISISGTSQNYAINLAAAGASTCGINISTNYTTPLALGPNGLIAMNGLGNAQGISYDSAKTSLNFNAAALEVSGHSTYPTAGTIAGYLGMYVNGTLYKVPFYNV